MIRAQGAMPKADGRSCQSLAAPQGQIRQQSSCTTSQRSGQLLTPSVPRALASGLISDTDATSTSVPKAALEALFATATEQVEEVKVKVTGTIPDWLNGSLITNGGGDYTSMTHMFDGLGLLNKLCFSDGDAFTMQRFVGSKSYQAKQATGKPQFREFHGPRQVGSADLLANAAKMMQLVLTGDLVNITDNASVNLYPRPDGTLLAVSETVNAAYIVDPRDLRTLSHAKPSDSLKGFVTIAHGKVSNDGQRLVSFTRVIPAGGFTFFEQDLQTLTRRQLAFVRDHYALSPAWVHDYAVAGERYAVVVENPLTFNLGSLMLGLSAQHGFLDWKPQLGTRIIVVDLKGEEPTRFFSAPAFFTYHTGNAWVEEGSPRGEEDGPRGRVLHLDLATYEDGGVAVDSLLIQRVLDGPGDGPGLRSSLSRLSLPLDDPSVKEVEPVSLVDPSKHGDYCDFPAVSPLVSGRRHRYVYMHSMVPPSHISNAVSKVDVETGEVLTWRRPGAHHGGPLFVPRPGGELEDDGVVLVPLTPPDGESELAVLDAATWTELATARLGLINSCRFHGTWLPA